MDLRKAGPCDSSRGIDWLTGIKSLDAAIVIVALEGKSQGIHFYVAALAIHCGSGFLQSVAKRGVFFLRNAGIYANGHIRYRATKQVSADPLASLNRMVFKVSTPCGKPSRMGQDACTFISWEGDRLFDQRPFPVMRKVEAGLIGP